LSWRMLTLLRRKDTMVYLTGDVESLFYSNRWGMSSTDIMADWDVFYSLMNGYGFWGQMIPKAWVWVEQEQEEMAPF